MNFESENEIAVLIGESIELFDNELNVIKKIKTGAFVKTIEKSRQYYNNDTKDETCDGYRYIKIVYEDTEYITKGKVAFKLEKLETQPQENNNELIFFKTSLSQDYLQVINLLKDSSFANI